MSLEGEGDSDPALGAPARQGRVHPHEPGPDFQQRVDEARPVAQRLGTPTVFAFAALCVVMAVAAVAPWQVVYVPAGNPTATATEHGLDRVEGVAAFWLSVVVLCIVLLRARSRRVVAAGCVSLGILGFVTFGLGFSAAAGETLVGHDFLDQVHFRYQRFDTAKLDIGWGIGLGLSASTALVALAIVVWSSGTSLIRDTDLGS